MRAWDDSTPTLMLFTPEEFGKLPDGTQLEAIDGEIVVKGQEHIDMDTRLGYMAYGSRDVNVQSLVG
jgi:hypothetical protein